MARTLALAVALATAAVACGASPTGAPKPPQKPNEPGSSPSGRTVVAAVVVDQLAAWVLEMHRSRWQQAKLGDPECRGFCRLMREGELHPRMEYTHAITDTAPGHATLFTGVPPHEHGISQNEKVIADVTRPSGVRPVGVMFDEQARMVTTAGVSDTPSSSLIELRVPTVADQLRAAQPDACILSVSLKDRAALFGGGRKPTLTTFYEPAARGFVTSSAFAKTLPPEGALSFAPGALEARVWTPLDPSWLSSHAPTADDHPGEGSYRGLGSVFPHPIAGLPDTKDPRPHEAYRMTPFGDEDVRTVGRNSLALCRDAKTVLVTLSFSSHDYILHGFGAHSWEAFDEFARLDRTLAGWLDDLDAAFGRHGWSLALSADHGSIPLPELTSAERPWCAPAAANPWELPCGPGVRLWAGKLALQLEARAERELGKGPWIGAVTDPRVVLSARAKQLSVDVRTRLVAALRSELMGTGGVETVVDLAQPRGPCGNEVLGKDTDRLIDRTVCFSQAGARAGSDDGAHPEDDLYVVVKKGSFFDPGYTPGKGESHGSPWLYDRAVPLLLRPAGTEGPRNVVDAAPISYRHFAHTLRAWLRVSK